jgi:hypothetical protein
VTYIGYAKQRYDAAIREIERLKQSEFPYAHIRDALLQLEQVFRQQRASLDKLSAKVSPPVAKNACSQSLAFLFNYTPYLGFVLRATNVRNAFETYAPILRLARRLLRPNMKLLLSSEWEYSPFVYLPTVELPDFVLIGVPAYESANPLLVSLAGHELGHNVWTQQSLGQKLDTALRDEVLKALTTKFWGDYQQIYPKTAQSDLLTNMFVKETWLPGHVFAKLQLEEIFCDVMGLRLFSEAYLHAFAYLLSPCVPGERSPRYPTIRTRVMYLLDAANKFGVAVPAHYADLFDSQMDPVSPVVKLLAGIADAGISAIVPQVIQEAAAYADARGVPRRSDSNVAAIRNDFNRVIPAFGGSTLTDIVNAGWACFHDGDLWNHLTQIRSEDRGRVLYDLVLKSFEVAEYTERINTP